MVPCGAVRCSDPNAVVVVVAAVAVAVPLAPCDDVLGGDVLVNLTADRVVRPLLRDLDLAVRAAKFGGQPCGDVQWCVSHSPTGVSY